MNNKAFGNNSVIHKRVFAPLRDLPTRTIEAIDHSSNSAMAFAFTKILGFFVNANAIVGVWRMVDCLYYLSRKIPEGCENSFVNYRINYQKLCDLMRQITKEMNWPNVSPLSWIGTLQYMTHGLKVVTLQKNTETCIPCTSLSHFLQKR